MPLRNQAVTVNLVCWDTVNNIGKTGDAANITVRGSRDGTLFTPSAPSVTQMDATNMPGVYKVSLTAGENDGAFVTLGGISSTASCVIIPISWANELTGDSFARLGAPAGASISADIATRLATAGYTAPANADVTAIKAKTDVLTFTGSYVQAQVKGQDNLDFGALQKTSLNAATPVVTVSDKTGFSLTSGERTAIANEVEAQIIDDTDSEKVLQAIVDKIAAANPSLEDLTLSAIASAIRTELATELGRIDAAVSTRLATSSYAAPDNAGVLAIKAKTDNLPASPAAVGSAMILTAAYDAAKTAASQASVNAIPTAPLLAANYTAPANADITAIKAKTDNLPASPAAVGSEMVLTAAYDAAKTAATQASINVIDNIVDKIDSALVLDGSVYQFTANALELAPTGGSGSAPTVEQIRTEMDANSTKLANLDAAISTRLATSGYTAPANADITAIKAKTDTIPVSPATEAKQNTIIGYIDTEIAAILAAVDTEVAAIKAKTDNLPASPAAVGSAMVLSPAYDAAKSAASQASVDAIPTTPLLAANYTAPDNDGIAALDAKIDALSPGIKKNTALPNFTFSMVSKLDHATAVPGKTVTCKRSINGGAFGNCDNATATEIGAGAYKVDLTSDDLNGDIVTLKFVADECDTRIIMLKTTI